MNKKSNLYGVILAGGSGSRLWPLSREMYPKQLLKLTNKNTLFQSTFLRLSEAIPSSNIVTVTNIKHSTDIKIQLNELKDEVNYNDNFKVLVEPIGRNTAPAIAFSMFYILKELKKENEDPIILVAPSDHMIKCQDKFIDAINKGIELAESGLIVTFGVVPEKPDTGYGYIKTTKDGNISKITDNALKVEEFKEKPDFETAKSYCAQGNYFWNAGIFMFKASVMMQEFESYRQDVLENLAEYKLDKESSTINFDDYARMPDISIDYAIMEHSDKISLIPIDCGWNDMGSWQAIYDVSEKDEQNNFLSGNVFDIDSQNSLVYSTSKLVTTIGLKDTVIIETEDAILACDKNRTQDVKKIFEHLKTNNDNLCMIHKTVYRPWGYYTVLQKSDDYLIKIIHVKPEAKLSLQMHYHRSEHWVILSGTAKVIKGDEEVYLCAGGSIDIPVTVKHSLENPGKVDLKIIEIQKGSYLEEDDIVRFEDIYGRA